MDIAYTHSGVFHADDVVSAAILRLIWPEIRFVRTRDPSAFQEAAGKNITFDVGMAYSHELLQYDHHQLSSEVRLNGCPYAAAGLLWKHYGMQLLRSFPEIPCGKEAGVWADIDHTLIQGIDALDNGVCVSSASLQGSPETYIPLITLASAISSYNPIEILEITSFDAQFEEAVQVAVGILRRYVLGSVHRCLGEEMMLKWARNSNNHSILTLEVAVPWRYFATSRPYVLFVVFPSNGDWYCQCVPKDFGSFDSRILLPESWAGLEGEALAAVTGVESALFAHKMRFVCSARDRAGAVRLAELAIASVS